MASKGWHLLLAFSLFSAQAWAQSTYGLIVGVVTDETKAVVPGATVTAKNEATNIERVVETSDQGEYRITNLLPGNYTVTVEKQGFKKASTTGVIVRLNESVRADFAMQVGEITQTLEVSVSAQLLETSNSTVGTVVTNEKIVELPLNGRDFTQLTLLIPGASPGASAGGFFIIGGQTVAVTGNRSDQNNYTLDGVNNNETFFKHYGIRPSIDAIQEFKVQTNITSAEYGEAAGANVNIAVKSGTNSFHGSLFEFLRNDVFDARETFASRKQKFRWNQFGGTFGGPIKKDKTFFFANYEGFRLRRESNTLSTVPTEAMMRGDFSRNVDGSPAPPIFDPFTTRPNPNGPGFIRDPFPGNLIPSGRFNPVSLEWQKNLYEPNRENRPGNRQNFVNTTPTKGEDDQYTIRIDHKFNDKNTIFGRYSQADNDRISPQSFPGTDVTFFNHFRNYVISDTHIFNPTTILDIKFGFNQDNIERGTEPLGTGIPGLVAKGLRDIPGKFRDKFDFPLDMAIAGFAGAGLTAFQSGPQKTWQILPSLSQIKGTHNLKYGADIKVRHVLHDGAFASIRHDRLGTSDPQDAAGITGQAYASFLLGTPSSAGRTIPLQAPGCESCTEANMKQDLWHFYVQDDIKVRRNLTLNVGLRYEWTSWYRSLNDPPNSSWFDTLGDGGRGRFVWAGPNPITGEGPNTTPSFIAPDKNNWAPRIGLAYLLGQKTTIRTGYSVFYGSNIAWEGNHMRGNWPFAVGQDLPVNRADTGPPQNLTGNAFPPLDPKAVPPSAQHTARRDNVMPYVQQWNFGIQHELVTDLLLEVNYVGSKGTRLASFISGNDARPEPGEIQPRRPFPQHLGAFSENRTDAVSSYHGLTVKLDKRFAKGLSYRLNYSWSHSMDLNSQWGGTSPQNAYDARASIGLSDFDRRHIFSGDFIYLLPVTGHRGVVGQFVNGWQVNGIIAFRSGNPLTPTLTFDNANTGSRGNFQRPNVVGTVEGPTTRQEWFNTRAFATPLPFNFGNAGRNIIEGPGYANVDFALYKNFMIREGKDSIQFRSEFFNIFNRTNFNNPGTAFGTAGFGRITGTQPARQIQFALKYLF
ncbi:MAG: TonB-dependent receptor [Acidobacteriota bacterium]